MLISYEWLQEYFDNDLPEPKVLADTLTMQAYEVEEVNEKAGQTILDIDVLPNRAADSLSHYGIAREVGTLLEMEKKDLFSKPQADDGISSTDNINLKIESDHVRRATKRLVTDVEVGESSERIKERLQALDQQPINNVVDLTNYVMLATGQPVHAFDYDKLAGEPPKDIYIREAKAGEEITTLDGQEYELEEGMLVIADKEKPLDIAGIKGGMNSHIDEDTERIMLSVCSFDPAKIRKTSQALNLRTDASKRFENDISPEAVRPALDHLSTLLEEHAGGTVSADVCEKYPRQANEYVTGVSVDQVNDLVGADISEGQAKEILKRCHCEVDAVDPVKQVLEHARDYEGATYKRGASVSFDAPDKFDCSSYTSYLFSQYGGVSIPRISVDQFMFGDPVAADDLKPGDLVFYNTGERIIHYETQEFMPGTPVEEGIDHPAIYLGGDNVISATSYTGEVTVTNIDNPEFGERIGIRRMAEGKRLRVKVPHWRRDLRSAEDLIEEIGRVYGYENIKETTPENPAGQPKVHKAFYYSQKIRDMLTQEGFSEVYTYAFQSEGEIELKNPIAEDKRFLRESLKPGLQQALKKNKKHKELLDGQEITIFEIGNIFEENQEILQLGLATTGDQEVINKAVQNLADKLDIAVSTLKDKAKQTDNILMLNLEAVISELDQPDSYDDLQTPEIDITYKTFSRFPYVLRDIAFWVPQQVKSQTPNQDGSGQESKVERVIQEAAGDLLVNLKLFDEYDPDDEDRVSLAFRLVFQSDERTLSDEEVNEIMDDVYAAAENEGWETR